MKTCVLSAALLALCALPVAAQCGQAGTFGIPQISVSSDLIGKSTDLTLAQALPGAPWIWLVDANPGPTSFPFGTLCLGASPLILLSSYTGTVPPIGPGGSVTISGTVPLSADPLVGVPLHMQAVVVDPGAFSFIAISNDFTFTIRRPHLFLLDPGASTPVGSTPGSLASFDTIGDTTGFNTPLPGVAVDFAHVPSRRLLAVLMQNGDVLGFDQDTGAVVLNVTPPAGPVTPFGIQAASDGGSLVVLYRGVPPSPFGSGTPGALRVLSLPTGATATTVSLASANPDDFVLVESTSTAYLLAGTDVVPVNYVAGTESPAIDLGSGFGVAVDHALDGGALSVLMGGTPASPFGGGSPPGVAVIDAGTGALLTPTTALTASAPASRIVAADGSAGPALFVLSSSGSLVELAAFSLVELNTASVPAGTALMEPSAGGTELVLAMTGSAGTPFGGGNPGSLMTADPATLAVTSVAALPPETQQALTIQPSDVIRRGFMVSGGTTLLSFPTDPAAGPGPGAALPIAARLIIAE